MTRSFIFLTLLVSLSAVERYVLSEPPQPQPRPTTSRQRDGGLKRLELAPHAVKLPQAR